MWTVNSEQWTHEHLIIYTVNTELDSIALSLEICFVVKWEMFRTGVKYSWSDIIGQYNSLDEKYNWSQKRETD